LSGERSQHKNAEGGTILREEGKRSREHGEHVFSLVFPDMFPKHFGDSENPSLDLVLFLATNR